MFIALPKFFSFAPLGATCLRAEHSAPDGAPLVLVMRAINISLLWSEKTYSHRRAFIGSTFVARNAGM